MKHLLYTLFLAFLLAACKPQSAPYDINQSFWPPVEPEADSLVAILNARTNHLVFDLADTVLAERIDSIGRSKNLTQLRTRALYWKVNVGKISGTKRQNLLDSAAALCDTSAYMYDCMRIARLRESTKRPTADRFEMQLRALDEFRKAGDSLQYANTLIVIAQSFIQLGDTTMFLKYFRDGTDLLHRLGAREISAGCDFSLANFYFDNGDLDKACAIVDTLRKNPFFYERASQPQVADIISYSKTRDVSLLLRALARCDSTGKANRIKPWLYAKLAEHYMDRGCPDSMRYYKECLYDRFDSIGTHRIPVYESLVRILNFENKPDSADFFQREVDYMKGAAQERIQGGELQDAMNERLLRILNDKNSKEKGHLRLTALTLALLLVFAIGGILLGIRIYRARVRRMDSRLRREERRTSIAKAKGAEKERAMAEIIENAEKNGDFINPVVAKIKARLTPESDWQRVELLFSELNPEFMDRLRKRFPGLTPAEGRLACLIYLGLDTKHMARLLSIETDSVKKTRQRLRAKLAIPPTTNLRDFIAQI